MPTTTSNAFGAAPVSLSMSIFKRSIRPSRRYGHNPPFRSFATRLRSITSRVPIEFVTKGKRKRQAAVRQGVCPIRVPAGTPSPGGHRLVVLRRAPQSDNDHVEGRASARYQRSNSSGRDVLPK